MRFFSSGERDCENVSIPMGSTLDDRSKRQRRTSFLLDRFVDATLGVGHPMICLHMSLHPRDSTFLYVGDVLRMD
jgi:hypothetical protein